MPEDVDQVKAWLGEMFHLIRAIASEDFYQKDVYIAIG